MKLTVPILLLTGMFACAASAADAPATSAPMPIELKNKSNFKAETSGRNPFWPIGWKPAPKVATTTGVEHAGPEISPSAFTVTSITYDRGARYAIVNGRPMTEGQQFGLQMGTQTYQLTVKSIDDGRVVLMRRDQEIIVPLRRR